MESGEVERDAVSSTKTVGPSLTNVFKTEFDAKYNILDIQTPLLAFMSGHYRRSYAYFRLRNHLPVVLTKVIDCLTKEKNNLVSKFGENAREEVKIIIGLISRLKYELQTDKAFQKFSGDEPDSETWNKFITGLSPSQNSFYKACWMHAECYMYRKLYSFVENCIFIKKFDYFEKIKEHALVRCQEEILTIANFTRRTENNVFAFGELMIMNLWSGANDLFDDINAHVVYQKVLEDLNINDEHIIANDISEIWNCLCCDDTNRHTVDIVLDNGGLELFTDLILAEYIIEKGMATKVCFHAKAIPWFESNVTEDDFHSTLKYLSQHPNYIISLIAHKFMQFIEEGKFEVKASLFWTSPHAFSRMPIVDPELYNELKRSKLVIFKGDLNYRKLLSDVYWTPTQSIALCSGDFLPSCICAVRIVKSEVICGLSDNVAEGLSKRHPDWMANGKYGVIQFVDGSREYGY